jgi:CCR4-NOT transcription complex subunit 3
MAEGGQLSRDSDFFPGQPIQSAPTMLSSANLGVIGRRSATSVVSDLGTIGDNFSGASGNYDLAQTLKLLESAFCRLPQPKDSERSKSYVPVRSFFFFFPLPVCFFIPSVILLGLDIN